MKTQFVLSVLVGLVSGCAVLPAGAPEAAPPVGTQAAAEQPQAADEGTVRMNFGFLKDLQMTSSTSSVALPYGPEASPSKQVARPSEKELKDV